MSKDLISKRTRNEFREYFSDCCVLREIRNYFDCGELVPNEEYTPTIEGQRRGLVEQYYENINFANLQDIKKLLIVYEEVILSIGVNSQRASKLIRQLERDNFSFENGHFVIKTLSKNLDIPSVSNLEKNTIQEEFEKIRKNMEQGHHTSAITNCYTLVESVLKEILKQREVSFNQTEGDIRELYKWVADALNLNPKGEHLENHLRMILQGLKFQISGLFEVANKASDRHARIYNPAPHHARLAVNATITLTEFLLSSYEYQIQKTSLVAPNQHLLEVSIT